MKRILFRADAKPAIGIGDLMSLAHLSEYFVEHGWEAYFLIRRYPAALRLVEKKELPNVTIFDENASLEEEVGIINKTIKRHAIDCLFFEITERRLSDYRGISEHVKKACVNFDGHIPDDMGLVVNWDITPEHFYQNREYPDTKFLLGPDFVILPKSFYGEQIASRRHSDKVKKVLIAMGGADEFDFTRKVVDAVAEAGLGVELNIIVGAGYEQKSELLGALEQSGCNYTLKENISDMLAEYLTCDVAVGAGGLISSELVASKTPAILIATYEHQVNRCQFFAQKKLARYLGYRRFDPGELIDAIRKPLIPSGSFHFKTDEIIRCVDEL